jgi:hypothetical protein
MEDLARRIDASDVRVIPRVMRFGSAPRLIATLTAGSSKPVILDMMNITWIEALPIAIMASFLLHHQRAKCQNENGVLLPRKREFLQRMDFFRTVGVVDLEEKFERRDSTGRFVPCQEILAAANVHTIAAEIVSTLNVKSVHAARVLRHCVGEVIDNVFVHARSPTNAIVCAQHFPNAEKTQVGIVDTGLGFRGSFNASPKYAGYALSHRDAVTLGLAPYVTSKPYESYGPYASGYGRLGVGLFIVSYVLARIGGQFLLSSGDALHRRTPRGERWQPTTPWAGAIIGFEVPDHPLVPYEKAIDEARSLARQEADERGGAR